MTTTKNKLILRNDPFNFLSRHMDRMFGLDHSLFSMDEFFHNEFPFSSFENSFPVSEIHKKDNSYTITMALAGYKREDIEITKNGDMLTIKSEKMVTKDEQPGTIRISAKTLAKRAFKQMYVIGEESEVSAKLEDGLLTVTVTVPTPKRELSKNIEIK